MFDEKYRPVHTACINPEKFPQVALYMQSGANLVLYKPADRPITHKDLQRLHNNQVEHLYINAGSVREVCDFFEESIAEILASETISAPVKGQLLSQVAMNYVMDVFEMPDKLSNLGRCRNLVRQLMQYITANQNPLEALHALVSHDFYTFAHSVHVASLSLLVHAEVFGLTADELEDVGIGGILHDVGMIFVPSGILEKTDILTNFEYNLIKKHAERGYECLRDLGGFSEISLAAVRYHHERNNGEGYPFQLAGDEIPRTAQVTAICDVFSALTSNRPYKKAMDKTEAIALMESVGKDVFSPCLLTRFKEVVLTGYV
jgi:HD-GYP domain-containing protein (c-di-GMP phosphodiesterase class II)